MRKIQWFLALCMLGAFVPSFVAGQSIGVHFPADRDNAQLQPDELAGVHIQANWNSAPGGANNVANASGDTTTITLPNDFDLLTDSDGNPVGTTVEWVSNGTWNTTNGLGPNTDGFHDAKLMNGYIDAFTNRNLPERVDVTFRDIPYATYDAIVYVGSDGNNRQGNLTNGTTTYRYLTQSNDPNGGGGFEQSDYIQITTTDANARQPGNYAVFPNMTSSSATFSIIDWTSGNNNGIHAVQLINRTVPEPATFGLSAMALLGLAGLRRRMIG